MNLCNEQYNEPLYSSDNKIYETKPRYREYILLVPCGPFVILRFHYIQSIQKLGAFGLACTA